MTQTLQEALLKAGLVSKEKLQKVASEKKMAERREREAAKPQPPRPPLKAKVVPLKQSSQRFERKAAERPVEPKKKTLGFIEGKHHHHLRTDCEACEKSSPDVEYYQHPNRSFPHYWLCVRCADEHNILDDFRQTKQSQHSMSGAFRRNYGRTI